MTPIFGPVLRQSLSDDLAERIQQLIQAGDYEPGDRLPPIYEMARRFGVGHPTLREALKKLETVGVVHIRHGSGVYVAKTEHTFFLSNPVFGATPSRKLLIDLIEARIPIEMKTVALAAVNAAESNLETMRELLARAGETLDDDAALSRANMAFHREIALASGNTVLGQVLEALSNIFQNEQRYILDIYGSRRKDHEEHVGILEALRARDEALSVERMCAHLEGVREVLLRWTPTEERVG